MRMKNTSADKLHDLVSTVRALPQESQDLLLREIEDRVTELTTAQLRAAQRKEIKARLAMPRRHVPDDEVRDILRRYNPEL